MSRICPPKPRTAPHGTRSRYARHGDPCRCRACRQANADYQRARRSGALDAYYARKIVADLRALVRS